MKRREIVRRIGLAGLAGLGLPIIDRARAGKAEAAPRETGVRILYAGTYTNADSRGIHLLRLNMATGELVTAELAAEAINPSYLAIAANGRNLYAVSEVNSIGGETGGGLTSFAIEPRTGALRRLNQVGSRGGSPCYVTLHPKGTHALVANYGGGNLAVIPVRPDGSLASAVDVKQHSGVGANPQRQPGPRAHCVLFTPDQRHVVAVDLGIDKVMVYRWNVAGRLDPAPTPHFATRPGAGPRHLAFHPNGRLACLINELDSTLVSCAWDARQGEFREIQTVPTLPESFKGTNYCADVHFHPNGRFVYGSNRGHDSLAIWRIDPQSGRLELVGHESTGGRNPRNFVIDPTGRWLLVANQASDSVIVFRIDPVTGRLTRKGEPLQLSLPVCLKFL